MPTPAAQHPDHGCHHELAIGRQHVHACDLHWMEPIAAVAPVNELPDPPDPPTELVVRAEQKRRADAAARKARQRNRRAGGAS